MFWEEPSSEVEDALASVDIDCSSLSTHPSLNDISVDRLSDVFERTLRDQRFDNPMGPVRRFSGIRKDLFWYLTLLTVQTNPTKSGTSNSDVAKIGRS
jgi:hypothetical protein